MAKLVLDGGIMNIEQFCQSVVYPIPPSFDDHDRFDGGAVATYLSHLHEAGAKVIMSTIGTSRFNLLSDEEILQLNLCIAGFQGTSIIALPPKSNRNLKREIDDVNDLLYLQDADAVMLVYPDRYYDDNSVVNFFHKMADKINKPVLFHGMFMRNARGGMYQYTPQLCKKIKEHANIVGMKEESLDLNMAYNISKLADDDFVVIPAGGSCRRYSLCKAAGAQTFLAGIGNYEPVIEEAFFHHCNSGSWDNANQIIREFEDPFMDAAKSMGWHKFLQEVLVQSNMLPTTNRPPFSEITADERQLVSQTLGLINQKLNGKIGKELCYTSLGY